MQLSPPSQASSRHFHLICRLIHFTTIHPSINIKFFFHTPSGGFKGSHGPHFRRVLISLDELPTKLNSVCWLKTLIARLYKDKTLILSIFTAIPCLAINTSINFLSFTAITAAVKAVVAILKSKMVRFN